MSTAFYKTLNPTPFGIFDDEADFQKDADSSRHICEKKAR